MPRKDPAFARPPKPKPEPKPRVATAKQGAVPNSFGLSPTPQVQIQTARIVVPELFPWQREVHDALHSDAYDVVICVTAQQIGKTSLAVWEGIDCGMSGGDVWWVAPINDLANMGYDILTRIVDAPPFNQPYKVGSKTLVCEEYKQRKRFTFRNGNKVGTMEFRSAEEPWKLRGATLNLVIADEASFMHPDAWHANLRERLTIRRGKALLISNPKGKNWLWELWQTGDPREDNPARDPRVRSFRFSQYDNPLIDPAGIEAKQKRMPWRDYRSQVLGEFVEDGGEVFIGVRDAAVIEPQLPPYGVYDPTHTYDAGMDISAGRQDWTVVMVYDATIMAQVAMYRFSDPLLSSIKLKLAAICAYWHVECIEIEENAQGMFAVPEFQALGLPVRAFNTNWKSKGDLLQAYSAAIELKRVRLLKDADLIREHEAMESDVAPGGTVRYHSPKSGHDDIVIASALGYRAATVRDESTGSGLHLLTHSGLYGRDDAHSSFHKANLVRARAYPTWAKRHSNSAHNE